MLFVQFRQLTFAFLNMNWPFRIAYDLYQKSPCAILLTESLEILIFLAMAIIYFLGSLLIIFCTFHPNLSFANVFKDQSRFYTWLLLWNPCQWFPSFCKFWQHMTVQLSGSKQSLNNYALPLRQQLQQLPFHLLSLLDVYHFLSKMKR